jgi:predicted transcriptional regulator
MNEDNVQVRDVTSMAAEIAAAFLSHNTVNTGEVSTVIKLVYESLEQIAEGRTEAPIALKPAVSIHRSIQPDHIVCLEEGRKFRSLKRHLRTEHRMTPDEYRSRWNLSSHYPMVAPEYAAQRSALAKSIGLGKGRTR